MIVIIDYGVGNLRSVSKALEKLGFQTMITNDLRKIKNSEAMILPGVGAFKDAMEQLKKYNLVDAIKEYAHSKKPILGICLGMQILFDKSWEDGQWKGLGVLKGEIIPFDNRLKIPHMGWNQLIPGRLDRIGEGLEKDPYVYFVHSYYLKPKDPKDVVFWTEYGTKVPAVVRKDNIIGMQFHPEKSGKTGMKLLENFGRMIR
ncbi:imidazole glycerol phosphate synthase subunit HisH [Garciella nitratireducens]|uniref:Imidazole glycerol phosphate synthase subunit HisH n=1 Tax=Garciella nitratireducens DSM 15102 TaxID=1121911 RepID=A0A1T4KNM8_9FIRM|nr:imidazole glycerol phosphate synthase subunit HisH [Garciella nitratireducens]SJZ43993.1 glutamine amidotransferase [Garciella nitratireducens DSM 15102]